MDNQIMPAKLISPTELLTGAWKIYKNRFWTFLGIILLPAVLLVILIPLAVLIARASQELKVYLILGTVIFGLAFGILMIWSYLALAYAIKDRQEKIGVIESFRRAKARLVPYIWTSFVSGFVVMGGFMLFIVPGIIFAVWFSQMFFVVAFEGERGMNALLKSKAYVQGRWGAVFGRLVFIAFVVIVISAVPSAIVSAFESKVIGNVLNNVISVLLAPLSAVYVFLLYENLKQTRGQLVFEQKGKGKFIGIAILGFLIIPILLIAGLFFAFKSKLGSFQITQPPSIEAP